MDLQTWLSAAEQQLTDGNVASARLDALILLEDCLQRDRTYVLAHLETELTADQQQHLQTQLTRRVTHEPLAYIRGHSEFYGRDFIVNNHVLVPRPESETIIGLLLRLAPHATTVVDVGTGSGALAVTAALQLPSAEVIALDNDPACLVIAKQNADKHEVAVSTFSGDLLEPLLRQNRNFSNTVLLCNLPYVPTNIPLNEAARHEPPEAIFAGNDGLDLYRRLFEQLHATTPLLIVTESLPAQHPALAQLAADHGYALKLVEGFVQAFTAG